MDPAADGLLAVWHRLVADPDSAAFADAALSGLLRDLAAASRADQGDVLSAAGDAVLGLIEDPHA